MPQIKHHVHNSAFSPKSIDDADLKTKLLELKIIVFKLLTIRSIVVHFFIISKIFHTSIELQKSIFIGNVIFACPSLLSPLVVKQSNIPANSKLIAGFWSVKQNYDASGIQSHKANTIGPFNDFKSSKSSILI